MNIKKTAFLFVMLSLAVASRIQAQTATNNMDVGFVTEVAVNDGVFRVLIPTATDSTNLGQASGLWNGGVAQENVFVTPVDTSAVTVICPSVTTGFTFGTPAMQIGNIYYDTIANKELTQAEAAATSGQFVRYLGFLCPYTGTGKVGDQFATGSNQIKILGLINPALAPGQTINEAVVVPGKVQLLENGYTAATTSGSAADYLVSDRDVMISAFAQDVLVTAKVDAQITFEVRGVDANETVCADKTTTVASTPVNVNYGAPTVVTFVDAAQRLYVNSSANDGYVVTVLQDNNMNRQGAASCTNDGLVSATEINRDCIPNFGWASALAPTAGAAWTDPTSTGLGYTAALKTDASKGTGDAPAVSSSIFGGSGGQYTRFATAGTAAAPVTIASSGKATDGDIYDVCYRLSLDAQNNAGVYDNEVTYTITASF